MKKIIGFMLLLVSVQVHSSVVYDFNADCVVGCIGTSTGALTLQDGADVDTFSFSDFVSFEYVSSSGTFFLDNTSTFTHAAADQQYGGIFLEEDGYLPGGSDTLWQFVNRDINPYDDTNNPWYQFLYCDGTVDCNNYCLNDDCSLTTITRDVGGGSFTRREVPEPTTISLLGLGLLGLVLRRRKS